MAARAADTLYALSDHQVEAIASAIEREGVACVAGMFTQEDLDRARTQAVGAVDAARGEYAAHVGTGGLKGHILAELATSASFIDLCRRLCRAQGIDVAHDAPSRQVLRCLAGASGASHAYYFHYDSFELTALVPIAIPEGARAGDLLVFPNLRRRRSSYLLNMIEKFVMERPTVQKLVKRRALRSRRVLRLKLQPGNLYFFNGNRSLHGNEGTHPDAVRATLLFHFAETHHRHWIRRLRRRARQLGRRQPSSSMRSG